MGRTYTKEKSYEERGSGKNKRRIIADRERKQYKHKIVDVTYEDDDDIEFEDDYGTYEVQRYKQK